MIKQLELNNFTCFKRAVFDFDMFNVIVGRNGTGKTSIIDGIFYVLTNRAPRMKRYIEELIANGEKEMAVKLIINNYEICRKRKRGLEQKTDLWRPRTKKEKIQRAKEIQKMELTDFSVKNIKTNQEIKLYNQTDLKNFISKILNVNPEFIDYSKLMKFSHFKSDHLIKLHPIDIFEDLFPQIEKIKEKTNDLINSIKEDLSSLNNQIYHFQETLKLFPEHPAEFYEKEQYKHLNEIKNLEAQKEKFMKEFSKFDTFIELLQIAIQNKVCPICQNFLEDSTILKEQLELSKENMLYLKHKIQELSAALSTLKENLAKIEKIIPIFQILPDKKELEQNISNISSQINILNQKLEILKTLEKNTPRLKTEIYSKFLEQNQSLISTIFYEIFEEIANLKIVPASEPLLYLIKDNSAVEFANLSTSEKVKVNLVITFLIIITYWALSVPFLFYDEIFDHLDSKNFQRVLAFFALNKLFKNNKKQIFLITHRLGELAELSAKNLKVIYL